MKSIDKLRESLKDCTKEAGVEPDKFDTYWITADACDHLIDEIEAEIAERYMLLPVDAEGVRVKLGDKLIEHEDGHEFFVDGMKIWGSTYEWWAYEDGGIQAPAMRCTHVKPRTLEDALIEYRLKAYNLYADQELTGEERVDEFKKLDAEYDSEIRELLGGDAE